MEIPKDHQAVMPYLILKDAAKFKSFVELVFGARQLYFQADEKGGIRHAEIQINGSTIMFADSTENWAPQTAGLYVYVPNVDETYRKALDQGATSLMEPTDQSYGRSSGVQDPCGNAWWITATPNK
jgi:PhnB protein